jgi:hypothetical protein
MLRLLGLFIAFFLLASCGETVEESSYEQRTFGPISVNESGFFSFDSLPEKAGYTVIAHDAVLGGLLYSGMQSEGVLGVSGEWEPGQSYAIRMKLYSAISSKIIDTTLIFSVNELFDLENRSVSGIHLTGTVNYNTNSITLHWNSLPGAEAYEIYTKSSSKFEAIYSLAGEVATKTNGKTDTTFVLQTPNWFANGDSAFVLVAARNGKGKSSFGEPFLIKDGTQPLFAAGPYINPDTANYVINATTYFNGTVNESILPIDINFNEPMDTSAVLSINIPALTPRPLNAELKWLNTVVLRISFRIGTGDLNGGDGILKIPVTISGLKDIADNKVMGTTVGTKTWEGLLILMYANGVPRP